MNSDLFEFENVDYNKFYCVHCGSKNLDGNFECLAGKKHMIDEETLREEVDERFRIFIEKVVIDPEEKKDVGAVSSSNFIPENISLADLESLFRNKSDIRNILNESFPHDQLKEVKEILEKIATEKHTRTKKTQQSCDESKLVEVFSAEINSEICCNCRAFVDFTTGEPSIGKHNFFTISRKFLENESYKNFVVFFLGSEPTREEALNSYKKIIVNRLKNTIVYENISLEIIMDVFSFEIIIEKLKNPKCLEFFVKKIGKLKNSQNAKYSELIKFLKHVIAMKLLKGAKSSAYLPSYQNNMESEYMKNVIGIQTNAYNFNYDFDVQHFVMIYEAKILENEFYRSSKRDITFNSGEYRETKKLIDFKNFFNKVKIGDGIKQVVYKKGTNEIYAAQNKTQKIDLGMGDFFAVYFDDDSNITIDILKETAYFRGVGSAIKKNISTLKKFGIEFEKLSFVSFDGKMTVSTSGILLKKILLQFFETSELKKYWFTKSQATSTNNHSFVYWPDNVISIPSIVKESVDFNIVFQSKVNIVFNKWEISFNGNQNSFIIPFFSKFFSLIHLMENLKLNMKYENVNKVIENYLFSNRKKKSTDNYRKLTDFATILVSQNEIAKRETYNRAIRNSTNDEKIVENFSARSKPIVFPIERFGIGEIIKRWKLFYASILLNTNPVFTQNTEMIDLIEKDKVDKFAESDIIVTSEKIYVRGHNTSSLGIVFEGMFFLAYPEKEKLPQLELVNNYPTKTSVINIIDKKTFAQKFPGTTSRKKNISPSVQVAIVQFTDVSPSKSGFYFPDKKGNSNFRDFINANYPNKGERHALVYQHMWDYTPEEIEETFDTINVVLHQDLLQNYHEASIFYFEFDTMTKSFFFREPRNRYGYYRNMTYEKSMFIFKMSSDRMDVIYFNQGDDFIPTSKKIRNFIKFDSNISKPVTIGEVLSSLAPDEYVRGQFFDTNGKSVGISVAKGNLIMDLRYSAQFPIYKGSNRHNFGKLTDTCTNVTKKFSNFDDRFTLIPIKTKKVKYQISKIHQETKNWKRDVYFFMRTFISFWIIANPDKTKVYTEEEIEKFVEEMTDVSDGRWQEEQEIDELTVIQQFDNIEDFSSYLEKIFPNRFYGGKFRVSASEYEKIKDFMRGELSAIKNCPPEFRSSYLSCRVISSLSNRMTNELSGINSVFYNNMICSLKEKNMNEEKVFYASSFSPTMDFNHGDFHSKYKKAEMVIIPFRGRYFIIRMTERGYFSIAVQACDTWFKKKEICSYYTNEGKSILCARKFRFDKGEIVESKDNEDELIKLSGEDYWVLSYNLKNGAMAHAAMLPIKIS